ncbi:hypothetical protein GCM10010168_43400 [Actinoplanes ianthinogenes]|uniref:Uncharacterized protein n=1 Tax=Actinoplanes ianthinogenes TaxID=122358 RepID=A0ABM7LVI5_9ACTN|nr:hypothetical protein Aiant_40080 [Actinoplanes ianthinogenes]GGR20705.1 hypothetical protein GCM10010168_43400 [Actinoplanes ianthinogenes]
MVQTGEASRDSTLFRAVADGEAETEGDADGEEEADDDGDTDGDGDSSARAAAGNPTAMTRPPSRAALQRLTIFPRLAHYDSEGSCQDEYLR